MSEENQEKIEERKEHENTSEIIETESLEEYIDKIERPIIKFSIVDEEKEKLESLKKLI